MISRHTVVLLANDIFNLIIYLRRVFETFFVSRFTIFFSTAVWGFHS